tara:strand:- start:608 stop:754 length:147 start_codon:yes stop_codon:yes gene_type:complete
MIDPVIGNKLGVGVGFSSLMRFGQVVTIGFIGLVAFSVSLVWFTVFLP